MLMYHSLTNVVMVNDLLSVIWIVENVHDAQHDVSGVSVLVIVLICCCCCCCCCC